jgi:alkanesulfonate monooxygenase SsuD/methylene tetrahydromethanopterin reductase-like flavin-dependent oxidoreductase (luciferase family)
LKNAICEPKPLQKPHPPIWIGGTGEKRTLKIVAKYADYCNFVCSPQQYQHKLEVLEKYCLEVGRSFQSIRKSWHGFLVLVEDSNSIREKIGSIKSKNPIERVREMTLQKFVDDHIVGTKQECIDKIQELVDAGVTYIVPHVYDFPTLQVTKILSQEIIPSFK